MSSEALARALVANLAAAGVQHVVLCPGSRSAPLAYALADAESVGTLKLHVRLDERSAGFVALGIAKVQGVAAVVTTSGTAVANLHPAVLEASHAGVGLVVVSADRPAELRGTGANQTTHQPGIFGHSVRYDVDLPTDTPLESIRGTVARVLAAARGTLTRDPGPVHLNVQFRPPLGPPADRGLPEADPIVVEPPAPVRPSVLDASPRTLVIAGDGAGHEIAAVAERAGWPLFAEPSSGARTEYSITHYRHLLKGSLPQRVERVVVAGHPTLSRPISTLLARTDIEIVVVSQGPRWTDVAATAARVLPAIDVEGEGDREWLAAWRHMRDAHAEGSPLSSAERCAQQIWAAGGNLVLGSSSTIRAFDTAADGAAPRVWANRGLAGIDGTISTATGISLGLNEPVRVVVGDLTFLHDATALVRGVHEADVDLQVIVFDDGGGSIFRSLEYGAEPGDEFDRMFATPQSLDIPAFARSLRATAIQASPEELEGALRAPIVGRSLIHVGI